MERNCDVITFISKYLILIRRRVANFAGIIRIATMFIEKNFKGSNKVQRIINYVLKMQPISVFLNITKVPVFGAKMLISAERKLYLTFCVCVKRITLCNCLYSSSSSRPSPRSSREFASVIRNIGKFGAKNYFTDHQTANTILVLEIQFQSFQVHDCY